jgi:hypothetical protein
MVTPLKESTNVVTPLKESTNVVTPLKESTNVVTPLKELVDYLERVIMFLKGQQIRCFPLSEGGSRALYR